MAQTPDTMDVNGLHAEASGLLRRWSGKKLPCYDDLSKANVAVENKGVDNVGIGDPEAVALRNEIERAWLYERAIDRSSSRSMTYVCVGVSLLIMFLVGSLYVFHNQGAALLAEMQTLAAKQPDRRFGQLERQLLIARSELFPTKHVAVVASTCPVGAECPPPPADEQPIDELAREASYVLLHELRDLNASLSSLEARKNEFQKLAVSPVPGLGRLWEWVGAIRIGSAPNEANAATAIGSEAQPAGTNQGQATPPAGKDAEQDANKSGDFATTHFCRKYSGAAGDQDATSAPVVTYPQVLGMDMEAIVTQACNYSLNYTSMTVPSVNLWAMQVKSLIAQYSAWILPALFACLGAMIYFLRLMVDPAEPNPRINRIVHRMALAALAGVIAGWFWEPAFGTNSEFQAAGLGLFTFAFIIGFSIEIFFSLLDRFVQISSTAITKLGS